ncbi:MAG: hypothetical protein EHM28_02415 [Spirochaetaceae bacterium]|nr:MAG: hypothetical protein EHM28_02415 [Spirochaetaceae bacterium]
MDTCELMHKCRFLNEKIADLPLVVHIMKKTFCTGSKGHCARYIIFRALGNDGLPPDLFPNHLYRAHEILSGFHGLIR